MSERLRENPRDCRIYPLENLAWGGGKEDEALKIREEAREGLVKKNDQQEKSKFKKGQADLEKELGF
jgi:hypothetical protein